MLSSPLNTGRSSCGGVEVTTTKAGWSRRRPLRKARVAARTDERADRFSGAVPARFSRSSGRQTDGTSHRS